MEMIRVEAFSFTYPECEAPALARIELQVERGKFLLLCGRSGCGKTTLLRSLKREIAPHGRREGRILINGIEQGQQSLRQSAETVGFVMQNPENQIVTDSVWHELAFGLENLGTPTGIIRRRVAETAHFFGIGPWFERKVNELSGGQKQILNLAAVMAMQPQVLVLDEPTAQLDPIVAKEFLQVLRRINTELGVTVVVSGHRLEDVMPLADRVAYMERAELAFAGTPQEFVAHVADQHIEAFQGALPAASRLAYALGGEKPYPISIKEGREWLARNADLAEPVPAKTAVQAAPEAVLTARNIWYRYGPQEPFVLQGLNLQLRPGEIHCILGGNGSGKSTALGVLAGLYKPARGTMRPGKGVKVGMLAQNPMTVFVCDTLLDDLLEGANMAGVGREEAEHWAYELEIQDLLGKHPYDLSGGEMQKAALCKLFLTNPNALLLDEPTKGLDAFAKAEIAKILRDRARRGDAVAIVTHDLEFAAMYADTCSMMFGGEIVCSDAGKAFFMDNNFYTTGANRMTRGLVQGCVTVEDVVGCVRR